MGSTYDYTLTLQIPATFASKVCGMAGRPPAITSLRTRRARAIRLAGSVPWTAIPFNTWEAPEPPWRQITRRLSPLTALPPRRKWRREWLGNRWHTPRGFSSIKVWRGESRCGFCSGSISRAEPSPWACWPSAWPAGRRPLAQVPRGITCSPCRRPPPSIAMENVGSHPGRPDHRVGGGDAEVPARVRHVRRHPRP